jgi:hypothetical protein
VVFGAQKNKEEQNMRRKLNDEKSWIFGESPSNPAVHLKKKKERGSKDWLMRRIMSNGTTERTHVLTLAKAIHTNTGGLHARRQGDDKPAPDRRRRRCPWLALCRRVRGGIIFPTLRLPLLHLHLIVPSACLSTPPVAFPSRYVDTAARLKYCAAS